jgi:DNA-binding SARP family transcriptional activator
VEFRILGPLEVVAGGEPLSLGSARQRAVLARLLVQARAPVTAERLIDELWGERPPATAQHAVHVYISGIRKVLLAGGGGATVRSSPAGYVLDLERELVDAWRFERLSGAGQAVLADDPWHAQRVFAQALALWRGEALAEFAQFEFARREADRLEELRAAAVEGQIEAKLACGEHAEVLGMVSGLVAADPFREGPRRLLMLALYRAGRQVEALSAYRDACAALDEIGLRPGPELRALEAAILRHDASLLAPGAAAQVRPGKDSRLRLVTGSRRTPATAAAGLRAGESAGVPPQGGRRKVVTALFCSVIVSTMLGQELEPEVQRPLMDRALSELRVTVERHGGTIDKLIGDELLAVFGIPSVREDDALRAVRAAAEMRDRLSALASDIGVKLRFRAGINTGLVLTGDGEPSAAGEAVNVAARLARADGSERIVLSSDTWSLVRDAVEAQAVALPAGHEASVPRTAFRLLTVDPLAPGVARRLDAPIVGRTRELRALEEAWQRSVSACCCHMCTLLGMAGVGKSRLVTELIDLVGDQATVLRGRCLHYGEGITFWPLVEALGVLGARADPVLEHLSGGGAAVAQELFWEVRRLLEALALERPLILHVDDLQWAQSMLFDLLENVAALSRGAPIMLLCTARPQLLEERPSWGVRLSATTLVLEPLDASDSARLLEQVSDGLDDDTQARVIAASEGNPLFLEEMAVLARERGTVAVPATIQALLAARLERLGREERELLECGAIEGEVFHRMSLCALAGERPVAAVEPWLAQLVRKDVIRPHRPTFAGDEAFRFRHVLIRDAAYDRLPKAARAQLHERFADWLAGAGSGLAEIDDIAGWHLEQAARYQRELMREADHDLSQRAAQHLYLASQRADERRDTAACRGLLERALALAPPGEEIAARIRIGLAGTLLESGELARAGELLSGIEHEPGVAALARLYQLEWLAHSRPDEATDTIDSILHAALELLETAGDERGLAKAHTAAWRVHWAAGRVTAAGEQAKLAAIHAHAAGDEGLRSHALGNYFAGLLHGPSHASEIRRELEAIEPEARGPYLAASINRLRAKLCSLEGRFSDARELMQLVVDDCDALGMPVRAATYTDVLVETEFAARNPAAALQVLQRADRTFEQHGEHTFRSTVQAYLGKTYIALNDLDAARTAIDLADQLSMPDDVVNYAITLAARARLALADGDDDRAERCARSALEHALRTEFLWDQAETRLTLAHVLAARGQRDAAGTEVRAALELYEHKGDRPNAEATGALLEQLRD